MKELDIIDISKRDTINKNSYRVVFGEQKRGSKTTNHKQSKEIIKVEEDVMLTGITP